MFLFLQNNNLEIDFDTSIFKALKLFRLFSSIRFIYLLSYTIRTIEINSKMIVRFVDAKNRRFFNKKDSRINASISVHTFSRRDDKARVLIESTLGRGTRFKPTLCSLDLQRSRAL